MKEEIEAAIDGKNGKVMTVGMFDGARDEVVNSMVSSILHTPTMNIHACIICLLWPISIIHSF